MKKIKGLIALDIDGTITAEMREIPERVVHYFKELSAKGWLFVFITGRTFDFGYTVLQTLPFEFYYAVQNGAILLSMPDGKILIKKYLDLSVIPAMEKICLEEPSDFVIYAGLEFNNLCFYRENHFSHTLLHYLKERQKAFSEQWVDLSSFDDLPIQEFPSLKCFGDYASSIQIAENIEKMLGLHVPVIKDPFCKDYYVVQATHPRVSKGSILKDLTDWLDYKGKVVAAGDDLNDLSMFEVAHIKIAMENAPEELRAKADIIAPSATRGGIIEGLSQAIEAFEVPEK